MQKLSGQTICKGVAVGKIKLISKGVNKVRRRNISNVRAEKSRYDKACKKAINQLNELSKEALLKAGKEGADIFEAYIMLIMDEGYNNSVYSIIENQKVNAEYAVAITGDEYADVFANMDDEILSSRSADIRNVSKRIIRILLDSDTFVQDGCVGENTIIAVDSLTPGDVIKLAGSDVKGFITKRGGTNSHAAIIVRAMGIPAITGVDISGEFDGKTVIIDGDEAGIIIDPDEEMLENYFAKSLSIEKDRQAAASKSSKKNKDVSVKVDSEEDTEEDRVCADSESSLEIAGIEVLANMGSIEELDKVLESGADGIGLLRSEFLYIESENYPTEQEQFEAYKKIAKAMKGKRVVIRTLDIGADKQVDYFSLSEIDSEGTGFGNTGFGGAEFRDEENPALGCRGIRVSLARQDVFKTQLRAIYKASLYGNVALMYPMITSLEELLKVKEISKEVREELIAEGVLDAAVYGCEGKAKKRKYGQKVEEGIMIETPAAALTSEELAKHADFFSIGTNDLTQYTMAADRLNYALDELYSSLGISMYNENHPAVFRLIKMTIQAAHEAGIKVGICGEMAADTGLTERFIDMGIDSLSVSPYYVGGLRQFMIK